MLTEWWWIGPAAVGVGTLGVIGLRRSRDGWHARRLGYDAARHALRAAQSHLTSSRIAVRMARAELARAQAERTASRATSADVSTARQRLQIAQRDTKAAAATVRVWRTRVSAERAVLPHGGDPDTFPLARLMAVHDAITARWMEYETDPAKLIAFPTMSDGRVPAVAAYLSAYRDAQQLRPASPRERITPAQFAEYREAVARQEAAFAVAEQEAWRQARATGAIPPDPAPASWTVVAQTIVTRSAEALARAAEAATSASGRRDGAPTTDAGTPPAPARARSARSAGPTDAAPAGAPATGSRSAAPPRSTAAGTDSGSPGTANTTPTTTPGDAARPTPRHPSTTPPPAVWPIPSRTDRRPRP